MFRPFTVACIGSFLWACASDLPRSRIQVVTIEFPPKVRVGPEFVKLPDPPPAAPSVEPVPSTVERVEAADEPCHASTSDAGCQGPLAQNELMFCLYTVPGWPIREYYDCGEAQWELIRRGLGQQSLLIQCFPTISH